MILLVSERDTEIVVKSWHDDPPRFRSSLFSSFRLDLKIRWRDLYQAKTLHKLPSVGR
jgi:hypothetical protein